jgi:hypothetical protein
VCPRRWSSTSARVECCARAVMESAEHGIVYDIKDAVQMNQAFAERNIA